MQSNFFEMTTSFNYLSAPIYARVSSSKSHELLKMKSNFIHDLLVTSEWTSTESGEYEVRLINSYSSWCSLAIPSTHSWDSMSSPWYQIISFFLRIDIRTVLLLEVEIFFRSYTKSTFQQFCLSYYPKLFLKKLKRHLLSIAKKKKFKKLLSIRLQWNCWH